MATHAREELDDTSQWLGFELSVLTIWVVVAMAGIFAPELMTVTDPTRCDSSGDRSVDEL